MLPRFVLYSVLAGSLAFSCRSKGREDADGDGFPAIDDCDDADAAINPDATELCNGVDDNCDEQVDNGAATYFFADSDGDGYGAAASSVQACEAPDGYVASSDDCDDADAAVHPGANELCNDVDDDCDGQVDGGDGGVWYTDADGDGYGDPETAAEACGDVTGLVADGTDCDDTDGDVHPGVEEICGDYDDDDCDGLADVGEVGTWHSDDDGDGYGHPGVSESTCEPDEGWVQDGTDCRPSDPDAYPGSEEVCNDVDDNCDGEIDEGMDADDDGYRSSACEDGNDCDDTDADVNPGIPDDACDDGIDNDCDGLDRPCGFWGGYDLSEADAHIYSDSASWYAAMLMDVGDATGDGIPDLLVSTLYADSYGGGGYVIPGPVSGQDELGDAGYRIYGRASVTYGAGRSIGIGDLEGDGVEDIGFGAPYSTTPGMYIEMGPITGTRNLASPDAYLTCTYGTYCGHGGDIGDFSGDGIADVIVGAYYTSSGGPGSGSAYAMVGPITADYDLTTDAVTVAGESGGYYTGRFIFAGGDVGGDGIGDVMVAAPYGLGAAGPASGIVYLVDGPVTITDFEDATARLYGASPNGYLGEYQSMSMGDMDGDGYADVVVGATTSTSGSTAGSAFVLYGPVSGDIDLHDADIIIEGGTGAVNAGRGLSIGDINGDGVGELLVGAPNESTSSAYGGAGYLFLTPSPGSYTTEDGEAWLMGDVASARAGYSAVLDDVNGDGRADAILGAPYDSTGAPSGGGFFVTYASEE